MLPTLNGRIQTRLFMTAVIGGLWSLLVPLFLPGTAGASTGDVYKAVFALLIIVGVLGVGWELVYHGLMQFRWEKDWPTLFGLLTFVNEGALAYVVAHSGVLDIGLFTYVKGIPVSTFLTAFLTTWLVIWVFVNGPMRIFTVHWRFRGGRLV